MGFEILCKCGHRKVDHKKTEFGEKCSKCDCKVFEPSSLKITVDDVNHPEHYNQHPSGVECIEVVEHMTFNVGNAIKYLWRAGLKNKENSASHVQDLKKAKWYITREINRMEREAGVPWGSGEEN